MLERKPSFVQLSALFMGLLLLLVTLSIPATVHAENPKPPDNGNCITCHEDLYFLHDTGKWFCMKESPMTCVDCHGGDPTAITKELAHTNFTLHPIVNDDVSKCQECHPEKCYERVGIFEQTAGISEVLDVVPYTGYTSDTSEIIPITGQQTTEENAWSRFLKAVPILLIGGATLIIYVYYMTRRVLKEK